MTRITSSDEAARFGLRAVSVTRALVVITGAPVTVTEPTLPGGNAESGPVIKNSASKLRSVSDHPLNVSRTVASVPADTALRSRFCICVAHRVSSCASVCSNRHPALVLNVSLSDVSNALGDKLACSPESAHEHVAATSSHTMDVFEPYTLAAPATNATSKHAVTIRNGQFSKTRLLRRVLTVSNVSFAALTRLTNDSWLSPRRRLAFVAARAKETTRFVAGASKRSCSAARCAALMQYAATA